MLLDSFYKEVVTPPSTVSSAQVSPYQQQGSTMPPDPPAKGDSPAPFASHTPHRSMVHRSMGGIVHEPGPMTTRVGRWHPHPRHLGRQHQHIPLTITSTWGGGIPKSPLTTNKGAQCHQQSLRCLWHKRLYLAAWMGGWHPRPYPTGRHRHRIPLAAPCLLRAWGGNISRRLDLICRWWR